MGRSSAARRLLVAVAPFVVACNAIVGLTEYKQGECSGGGSCVDVGSDGSADVAVDVREASTIDASGARPVSWARWRMPNYPQDGGPDVIQSYENAGIGYRDRITNLTWQQTLAEPGSLKTFAEAQQLCAGLRDGPWRLPTRIELVSLLDLRSSPTIDPIFAAQNMTRKIAYWTSSEVRPYGAERRRWTVNFNDGQLGSLEETDASAGVRCVRTQ